MHGLVRSLYRYPVKGFTPERMTSVDLGAKGRFPSDRLFSVENGPSGFDPLAPAFIRKSAFTVLAQIPMVACARTRFDDVTGRLSVTAPGAAPFEANLYEEAGRTRFALWLTDFLGPDAVRGPLKVLSAPGHSFTDDPDGLVSLVNLASVRDLEARLGRPVDPLRFRANLYVEGWAPWAELAWPGAARLRLGAVEADVDKSIVRCLATHVDPVSGICDLELVPALFDLYGHRLCGVYLTVAEPGRILEGDRAERIS
jgi:uncharacterized protein YcbX